MLAATMRGVSEDLKELRRQLEERARQWAAFNRWEAENPAPMRTPDEVLADLSAIWMWFPAEVRTHDPDPEKKGIQAMRRALALLKPSP